MDTNVTGTISERGHNVAEPGADTRERRVDNSNLDVSEVRTHRGHRRVNYRTDVSRELPSHSAQMRLDARHSRVDDSRPRGSQISAHAGHRRVNDSGGVK